MIRNKLCIVSSSVIAISLLLSMQALADIKENYENVTAAYGDDAAAYTYDVPYKDGTVSLTECSATADVKTACYVRSQPGMDTPDVGVIQTGTAVRVWGVTNNGWAAVYTSSDGWSTPIFGYMKKDLLFNISEAAGELPLGMSETGSTETAAPVETAVPVETAGQEAVPAAETDPGEQPEPSSDTAPETAMGSDPSQMASEAPQTAPESNNEQEIGKVAKTRQEATETPQPPSEPADNTSLENAFEQIMG